MHVSIIHIHVLFDPFKAIQPGQWPVTTFGMMLICGGRSLKLVCLTLRRNMKPFIKPRRTQLLEVRAKLSSTESMAFVGESC